MTVINMTVANVAFTHITVTNITVTKIPINCGAKCTHIYWSLKKLGLSSQRIELIYAHSVLPFRCV